MIFYIIYLSNAAPIEEEDLLALLEQCREKNRRLGVTGILLYSDGNFMQLLEGDKEIVLDLYEKIKLDDRHRQVTTIMTGDIEKRNFENFSMGFVDLETLDDFPEYHKYINETLKLRTFQRGSERAHEFMVLFSEINHRL